MIRTQWRPQLPALACALFLLTTTPATLGFQATPPFQGKATTNTVSSSSSTRHFLAKPSGTFFNPVPEEGDSNSDDKKDGEGDGEEEKMDMDKSLEQLMKERNAPSLASQPSTINGIPTSQAGVGFGIGGTTKKKPTAASTKKSYIGIGEPDKPLNDVTKPEYDDQGYTLYANEETGEKSRVFEALVEYPCEFTMKIVGANEGTFVEEILQIVADSCEVEDSTTIKHSTRSMGKWISVTVQAPVENAQMLYQLYENVDRDPRVKFKF